MEQGRGTLIQHYYNAIIILHPGFQQSDRVLHPLLSTLGYPSDDSIWFGVQQPNQPGEAFRVP